MHPKMTATKFGENGASEHGRLSTGPEAIRRCRWIPAEEVAAKIAELIKSEEPEAMMWMEGK